MDHQRPETSSFFPSLEIQNCPTFFVKIFEVVKDGILVLNERLDIVYSNASAEQIFRYSAIEVLGQPLQRFLAADCWDIFAQGVQRCRESSHYNPSRLGVIYGLRTDGAKVPLETSIAGTEVDGHMWYICNHRVLTAWQSEDHLLQDRFQLQDLLAKVVATVPGVVCAFRLRPDGSSCFPYAAPTIADLYGIHPEELLEDTSRFFLSLHPDDREYIRATIAESARTMLPWHAEYRFLHPHKGEIWLEGKSIPAKEADGSVLWYGFVHDITERKRAEARQRESTDRLQLALAATRLGVWEWDVRTDAVFWSPECYPIFGVEHFGNSRVSFLSFVHPEDIDQTLPKLQEAMLAQRDYIARFRILRPDGEIRWVSNLAHGIYDTSGVLLRVLGTVQDITEQQHMEQAICDSEERFRALVDASAQVVWSSDSKGFVSDVSPSWRDFTGQSYEECHGYGWLDVIHPEDRQRTATLWQQVVATRGPFSIEYRVRHHSGAWRWMAVSAVCLLHEDGTIRSWVGMNTDITERKEAEEALHDSQTRRRVALEGEGICTWVWNIPENSILWGDSAAKIFGRSPEEMQYTTPETFLSFLEPGDRVKVEKALQAVQQRGADLATEFRFLGADGTVLWIAAKGHVEMHPSGYPWRMTGACVDITERKRGERWAAMQGAIDRALADAESIHVASPRILQALCDSESWELGTLWEVDPQANVLRCTDIWHAEEFPTEFVASTRTTTFAPGVGLPGQVWSTGELLLIPPMPDGIHFPRVAFARDIGVRCAVAFPLLLHGKVTGVVECIARSFRQPDQRLLEIFRKIGTQIGQFIERKHAEQEKQRFISFSPAVIYALKIAEDHLYCTWVSENIVHLTGYSVEEVMEPGWWSAHLHPEDRERVFAANPSPYTVAHQIMEFRFRRKDGNYIWIRDEKRLVPDPQGQLLEVVGTWADVTERVKLEEQYRQAQKMEALGLLAGGIAHDFNNLLTIIMGYSEILLEDTVAYSTQKNYMEGIFNAGERAAALTRQLLAFSRKQLLNPQTLNLNDIVTSVEKMLRRLIGEDILLRTALAPSLRSVVIDPGQMEQVMLNLAVNARDAMPQGGQLLIETRDILLEREACQRLPGCKPGHYVLFTMRDTGCGMTPEIQERIFEPFFTTKERGKGTGLGLSTVFGIVRQSEGYIEVESAVGQGSCFKVYFPAVEALTPTTTTRSHGKGTSMRGRETIFLVEDEAGVRRVIKLALEAHGYTVLEASNGAEALTLVTSLQLPPHLLLMDVVMPKMSGRQLAEQLRERYPQLRVLFMSGYTDDAVIRHGTFDANSAFLQKPFAMPDLLRKVRDILDGKPR